MHQHMVENLLLKEAAQAKNQAKVTMQLAAHAWSSVSLSMASLLCKQECKGIVRMQSNSVDIFTLLEILYHVVFCCS